MDWESMYTAHAEEAWARMQALHAKRQEETLNAVKRDCFERTLLEIHALRTTENCPQEERL